MTDPIARGQSAQRAMDEFLAPAFETVNEAYTARLAEIAANEPWAADKIAKLAMAIRVTKEVRAQIEALIADGKHAAQQRDRARVIANIPEARRKYMGLHYHSA